MAKIAKPMPVHSAPAEMEEMPPLGMDAVEGDGAPAAAVATLTAAPHRVIVEKECPDGVSFRAQGWYDGAPSSVLSDWSGSGGGTVVIPVGRGADVRVQVQTSGPDGKRSEWIEAGTKTTPKASGLTTMPDAGTVSRAR